MPGPIVFISHNTIRRGKLNDLREMSEKRLPALEVEKPGTVLQHGYLNADQSEVHFIHVFPDADAMDAHMEGADQRVASAEEVMETKAFEIYGTPSDAAVEVLSQNPAIEITIRPLGLGGYMRLGS